MELTEAGRVAVQNRSVLSVRERQILLLLRGSEAGQRMVQEMGAQAWPVLEELWRRGLIRPRAGAPRAASASAPAPRAGESASWSEALRRPFSRGASAGQASPAAASPSVPQRHDAVRSAVAAPVDVSLQKTASARPSVPAAPTQPLPAARGRRSLAATKMYMIDMLQLLRNMDAAALAVDIQTSTTEHDLIANVLRGAGYFAQSTNASYADKVRAKLEEVIPEEWLPALRGALPATAAPSA